MRSVVAAVTLLLLSARTSQSDFLLASYSWTCSDESQCVKVLTKGGQEMDSRLMSLDGCKSVCGPLGSLWPRPTQSDLSHALTDLNVPAAADVELVSGGDARLKAAVNASAHIFVGYVDSLAKAHRVRTADLGAGGYTLKVRIKIVDPSLELTLDTAEEYSLTVTSDSSARTVSAAIAAQTFFGARHALETLSQLITLDDRNARSTPTLQIVSGAAVRDSPAYRYRGLLLDTGRNFFSVESILKIIDAMSYDKMNVFHWHMNEQQSFPFVSQSVPELTKYGAYSKRELYFKSDVQAVVSYARQRGVIVVPEMDAPAHASAGWGQWADADPSIGRLTTCVQKEWADGNWSLGPQPPAGQLNPLSDNVYEILEKLYGDLLSAFSLSDQPVTLFHMGGDEVNFPCWRQEPAIAKWMEDHGFPVEPSVDSRGYKELWARFQRKARERLLKADRSNGKERISGNKLILWTSDLARIPEVERHLPKSDYTLQLWCNGNDAWISSLLQLGYSTIFSNSDAWYLDCGFGAWIYSGSGPDVNWCAPFKGWQTMYGNSPRNLVANLGMDWARVKHLVWGGEAAMWSEQIDSHGVESRIWPRLSAVAERLWSDPTSTWHEAERRLLQQRHRLVQRGVNADVIQPEFCRQNDGYCYMPEKKYDFGFGFEAPNVDTNFLMSMDEQDRAMQQQRVWQAQLARMGVPDAEIQRHASFVRSREPAHSALYFTALMVAALAIVAVWINRRLCMALSVNLFRMAKERIKHAVQNSRRGS